MREHIPTLHQYVFMAWCLVKHRENFTIIIIIIIIYLYEAKIGFTLLNQNLPTVLGLYGLILPSLLYILWL